MSFEERQIAKSINKALLENISSDNSRDGDFLKDGNYKWDDLTVLKEELGKSVLEFVIHVNNIIANKQIIDNLGIRKEHFDKVVSMFNNDILQFSDKIKNLRVQHEGYVGLITNIDEFDTYNRLAIQYQVLFSELSTLVTPALSDIMTIISEIIPNKLVDNVQGGDEVKKEGETNATE